MKKTNQFKYSNHELKNQKEQQKFVVNMLPRAPHLTMFSPQAGSVHIPLKEDREDSQNFSNNSQDEGTSF
jgi:hypothetical protein